MRRISRPFTYRGPFPWKCGLPSLCDREQGRILAGERVIEVREGSAVFFVHERHEPLVSEFPWYPDFERLRGMQEEYGSGLIPSRTAALPLSPLLL